MRCIGFSNDGCGNSYLTIRTDNEDLSVIFNCIYECLENNKVYEYDVRYWKLYQQVANILDFVNTGNSFDFFIAQKVNNKITELIKSKNTVGEEE